MPLARLSAWVFHTNLVACAEAASLAQSATAMQPSRYRRLCRHHAVLATLANDKLVDLKGCEFLRLAALFIFEIHVSILTLHMQFSINFVIIQCLFSSQKGIFQKIPDKFILQFMPNHAKSSFLFLAHKLCKFALYRIGPYLITFR